MKESKMEVEDCKVVSVVGNTLTTTCSEGTKHRYTVADDAKVTCDGEEIECSELKPGTQIRVTPCKDDKNLAREIESGQLICDSADKM